jgi:hypothetical protein
LAKNPEGPDRILPQISSISLLDFSYFGAFASAAKKAAAQKDLCVKKQKKEIELEEKVAYITLVFVLFFRTDSDSSQVDCHNSDRNTYSHSQVEHQ